MYHYYCYSWHEDQKVCKFKTVVSTLFQGVIEACYYPLMIRHGLVVAFTGLRGFFLIGVCSITRFGLFFCWGVFRHPITLYLLGPLGVFESL